jgi:hypothetical protein
MLHAVNGPHAGTHWRLEILHHNGTHHVLRCSALRHTMRVRMDFHPAVFGLNVIEVSQWYRITRHDLIRCWRRIDEGLYMGALALIPLAAFEAFHGGEHARALIMSLLGGE